MDRFVVGTGRCGSTLLSRMLGEHPEVCSIHECLNGLDVGRRFQREPMAAAGFLAMLTAEQPFLTAVLRRGYPVEEVVYPFAGESGRGRRSRGDPMPYVLTTMLARLSDDPDGLLEEVRDFVGGLPPQPAPSHFRALFAWLARRAGRSAWIERSGSSVEYLPQLAAAFPEARFLHLHRDGPETALSMREHHAYRLPISVLYRAADEAGRPPPDASALDFASPPREGDAIGRVLAARPAAASFGRYWSDQLVRGLAVRASLGQRYREVAFETLIAEPEKTLREIADFFTLAAPASDWARRAAARVRGAPPTRVDQLSEGEADALHEACRPGSKLLGRATR